MSRFVRSTLGFGRKESASTSGALPERQISTEEEDDFHDSEEAQLHPDAHEEGGLAFNNKELLDQQRSAILELVKTLGKKLLTGSLDLINVSLPVKMFEPRSYLEKLADVWVYPRFLDQAARAQDPAERMALVVTWFVAGLQHAFQSWRKPFNPILGETWEAGLTDGSQIYMEQISHHPPVSAFQMFGPGGLYRFSGLSEPSVSYKANAIKTSAKGYRRFDFPDGMCIDITYPHYMMRGIMATAAPRADLVGTARFVDNTHRLCCEVRFGRVEGATHPLLERSDSFAAELFSFASPTEADSQLKKQSRGGFGLGALRLGGSSPAQGGELIREKVLAQGTGNWLSHFDWQGRRMWTLTEERPAKWQPTMESLPSDCRRRHDLVALQQGQDPKQAQSTKELLENLQRSDAKLRKAALEARSAS